MTPGSPRARLLVYWIFYAPSRRATFDDTRWCDIDLEQATWEVVGKGDQADVFTLAPPLLRQLRIYQRWQLSEAQRNPAMRDALSDPETAFVLLTRTGKRTSPESVLKMLKWHAIRADVASTSRQHVTARSAGSARESRRTLCVEHGQPLR
jgi:site-specific recombinase XerC